MTILIDSSIWVDFLRKPEGASQELAAAIRLGQAVICPIIEVEVWSGLRGKREEAAYEKIVELCPSLPMDEEAWKRSGDLRRKSLQKGLNCPLADVLIVACARRHGASVMHRDSHIEELLKL